MSFANGCVLFILECKETVNVNGDEICYNFEGLDEVSS